MTGSIDTLQTVRSLSQEGYKYGFVTDIEADTAPPGLNEDTVRFISAKKEEPEWLLEWRLQSFRAWREMTPPEWAKVEFPPIDYQSASYYAAPKQQAAQVTLENCSVKSPFAGVVVRKLLELGETSTPTSAGIFTVADLSDLEVQADVSESQFAKVKVTTPAEILLDAFPDKRFRGEVSEIRQSVDRSKASVTVKVMLPFLPGRYSFWSASTWIFRSSGVCTNMTRLSRMTSPVPSIW